MSSSVLRCHAGAAVVEADGCGTFLQSSSRTAPFPRAVRKSKDEPETKPTKRSRKIAKKKKQKGNQ